MNIKFSIVAIYSLFALIGCQSKQPTYEYLMCHPDELRVVAERCQHSDASEQKYCEMVMYAVTNSNTLLSQQQADPERFGQRILDSQMALAKTQSDITELTKQVQQAQTDAARQVLQNKLEQLQKMAADLRQEVQVMLAIAGVNSPE